MILICIIKTVRVSIAPTLINYFSEVTFKGVSSPPFAITLSHNPLKFFALATQDVLNVQPIEDMFPNAFNLLTIKHQMLQTFLLITETTCISLYDIEYLHPFFGGQSILASHPNDKHSSRSGTIIIHQSSPRNCLLSPFYPIVHHSSLIGSSMLQLVPHVVSLNQLSLVKNRLQQSRTRASNKNRPYIIILHIIGVNPFNPKTIPFTTEIPQQHNYASLVPLLNG